MTTETKLLYRPREAQDALERFPIRMDHIQRR